MDFAIGWLIVVPILGTVFVMAATEGRKFGATLITVIILGNAVLMGASWSMTSDEMHTEKYNRITTCDVAKSMGLEPERAYPIDVGSNVDGGFGEGYFQSGFFGGRGSFDIRASRAVMVGFNPPGKSAALLTLPTDAMKPVIGAPGSQPTITIRMKCRRVGASQVIHYSTPRLKLDSGIFFFTQREVSRDEPVITDEGVVQRGLAPLVAANLKSVEIHLSPELYAKILG